MKLKWFEHLTLELLLVPMLPDSVVGNLTSGLESDALPLRHSSWYINLGKSSHYDPNYT